MRIPAVSAFLASSRALRSPSLVFSTTSDVKSKSPTTFALLPGDAMAVVSGGTRADRMILLRHADQSGGAIRCGFCRLVARRSAAGESGRQARRFQDRNGFAARR